MNEIIIFTHYWVTGFGWENTIYNSDDFVDVTLFGESKEEGKVFICTNDKGGKQILRIKP